MATKFNEAFWRWFGDSKVVDAKGNPLVVYHGSHSDFTVFSKPGSRVHYDCGFSGKGFYFGSVETAEIYAGWSRWEKEGADIGSVYPVYLSMQNPLVIKEKRDFANQIKLVAGALGIEVPDHINGSNAKRLMPSLCDDITEALKRRGYDGVIYGWYSGSVEYTVLASTQIKSAIGNDGSWDADDPDIRSNPDEADYLYRIESKGNIWSILKDGGLYSYLPSDGPGSYVDAPEDERWPDQDEDDAQTARLYFADTQWEVPRDRVLIRVPSDFLTRGWTIEKDSLGDYFIDTGDDREPVVPLSQIEIKIKGKWVSAEDLNHKEFELWREKYYKPAGFHGNRKYEE